MLSYWNENTQRRILVCIDLTITLGRIWYHYFLSQICILICLLGHALFFTAISCFWMVYLYNNDACSWIMLLIFTILLFDQCIEYTDTICHDLSTHTDEVYNRSSQHQILCTTFIPYLGCLPSRPVDHMTPMEEDDQW